MARTMTLRMSSAPLRVPAGLPMAGYAARSMDSTGMLDELECHVVVLAQGATTSVFVIFDLLYPAARLTAAVRSALHERAGVDPRAVTVHATHTHCAPAVQNVESAILRQFVEVAVGCTREAIARALPVREVVTGAFELGALAQDRRRGGDAGASGRTVGFLGDGDSLLGSLAIVPCHPTILEADNSRYSPDYPGALRRRMEQITGAPAVTLLGACGDVNPAFVDHTARDAREFGGLLAMKAAAALYERARWRVPHATVDLSGVDAHRPVPHTSGGEPRLARNVHSCAVEPDVGPRDKGTSVADGQREWARKLFLGRASCLDLEPTSPRSLPVSVTRLSDDVRLAALPGEWFWSSQRFLDARAPGTILVANCDVAIGYLPDAEAFEESGYEVGATLYAKGTAELLLESLSRRVGA